MPPPPNRLSETIGALEKYIHGKDTLPPLLRAGLLHVQFETIHPYLDGNGRIGRLLISLLLEHWKLLSHPAFLVSFSSVTQNTIAALEGAGVLVETTGRRRDRSFAYRRYLDRLSAGTELTMGNARA